MQINAWSRCWPTWEAAADHRLKEHRSSKSSCADHFGTDSWTSSHELISIMLVRWTVICISIIAINLVVLLLGHYGHCCVYCVRWCFIDVRDLLTCISAPVRRVYSVPNGLCIAVFADSIVYLCGIFVPWASIVYAIHGRYCVYYIVDVRDY